MVYITFICSCEFIHFVNYRWLFEKYDGLRGFWNPKKNSIYSRFNTQFELPPEILATLPTDLFLDGELWCV